MAAEAAPILSVREVSIRFGGLRALSSVSFEMAGGSITAIIGPNGAGKTTLFNCITGFYRPTAGEILLHREQGATRLHRMPVHKTARAGVARTYQNIRLFSRMSVLENLLVAQHAFVNRQLLSGIFETAHFRRCEAEALERGWFWLRFMGLDGVANREAGTLPYGQRRRLEVARAMASRPRLICLDEPAAGLNRQETDELNALILRLKEEHDVSVLLIEHHMGVVMRISDRIVVLDHGEVICTGTPEEVQRNERVIKAYLGEEDTDAAPGGGNGAPP
ncbi:MAG: ATP-binding cassette domain-containing protein [SAR324 cluster bacterium]|nr:ATP-binding cassette domain-containing protein [SAR324 cluster bacterium]